jgi:4-amino-4-deoxy-L-arabinose transferase-like glycosyltransferase
VKRWLWLIAALALALRCWIALGSLDALDRWFVPDDTYYALGFARSLARGLGPTLDGVVLSNGFQPLLAFLLVPVFWVTHTGDSGLRAALLLGALCDVLVVVLLARIAERLAGRSAALICALLWAVSPLAIANALGGLETSLTLALELALVLAYAKARDCEALEVAAVRPWATVGVLAGLAILARIDAVFLVFSIAALELLGLLQRSTSAARRGRSIALLCAALVLLPWWSYSIAHFGTPIPESGAAVLQITGLHRERYLTVSKQLGWAAGNALGAPFFDMPSLRELLLQAPLPSAAAFAIVTCTLLAAAFRFLFAAQGGRAERRAAGALTLHALAVLAFYATLLPALWFFRRYLVPCQALFTLLFGLTLAWAWRQVHDARARFARRTSGIAICLIAFMLTLLGAIDVYDFATVAPSRTRDQGLNGAKGYREAARGVLAEVPAGAVLGALQSGALSYYAPQGVRVVNLDGVVDHGAREAATELRLSDYAKARGVGLISDWRFNLRAFTRLSKNARAFPTMRWVETQAESQGGDRFSLLALRWPDAAADQRK